MLPSKRPCPASRQQDHANRSPHAGRPSNPKHRRCFHMANIKSAKKRILVIETKTLRNKMIKSKIKTLVKKVDAAVAASDKAAAATALKEAVVAIDKAAAKGVYHKNTAARKVSRITKAVNSIA